jgi:tetratricopeptide (TPR) repeat protein
MHRNRSLCLGLLLLVTLPPRAFAEPYVPSNPGAVLAELPPGARHAGTPALAATRLDIALPLARADISRARLNADLRFLGYAEAVLAPWMERPAPPAQVLVLHAEILQSRHAFDESLGELARALEEEPDDAQAWLTRATVLRVLGRYEEAERSCEPLAASADAVIASLCAQAVRGLAGHLEEAYHAIRALAPDTPETRAWRFSELGEMAVRLGDDVAAEQWFRTGLAGAPQDLYMRTAFADLLLGENRIAEVLALLADRDSMEPALLRLTIAHRRVHDAASTTLEARLSGAFQVEMQRGEAVHRREQARYLLDVAADAHAALRAAQENWRTQREPDDALILLRSAAAAGDRQAAAPVLDFLRRTGLEDRRLSAVGGSS